MGRRIAVATGLFALLIVLKPGAAAAESPDPEALMAAHELFDLAITESVQEKMVESSWSGVEQMLKRNPIALSPDEIGTLKGEFRALLRAEFEHTMADTPQIYAKYFTAAELRDMLAFYNTETGRKTIKVMPAMMAEMMAGMNERMPAMMQRLMTSFLEILKKRGVKTR